MSATMSTPTPEAFDLMALALRTAIAQGATPRPAEFDTPDGLFWCRACQTKKPNETVAGWINAVKYDDDPTPMTALVCKECMP